MFGKKKHLLHDGAQARAVVVDAERHGGQSSGDGASPIHFCLHLRVHLDDGSVRDATCTVGSAFRSAGVYFSPGDIVPVRFDPTQPDLVIVDVPAMRAAREDQRRAAAEAAVEWAERQLAGQPDGPALPMDAALRTAHDCWKTAAARAEEARSRHEQAQAGDNKRETLRLFNQSVKRGAEEKAARENYNELHKSRPDWTPPAD